MATIPEEQRRFAVEVVRRLRGAGFEAYWAGGCVRDQLLGRTPKDYDVATDALPDQVRTLFGRRRTLAIGAAFGVIAVVGSKAAGTVEVTTFRWDAAYSDGRHPDAVTFSSAEEDAQRRDFTVNGLFYDPVEQRVIDFVGGQADLKAKRLRAIGDARQRFAEDKLRMLRAVRFAATFSLTLDDDARAAVVAMAPEICVVSPERIAMEMRRILADATRAVGVRFLVETKLAEVLLPEIVPAEGHPPLEDVLAMLARLQAESDFPLALATLLCPFGDAASAAAVCERWRLSNKETDRICWLVENHAALLTAATQPWSMLQSLLVADGAEDLLMLTEAMSCEGSAAAALCRSLLDRPREELDPPPLLDGNDLLANGIQAGPQFKVFLNRIRAAQLDGVVRTKAEALAMIQGMSDAGREAWGGRRWTGGHGPNGHGTGGEMAD